MWNKDRSALLSLIIVRICYALLAACCVAAPWLAGFYVDSIGGEQAVFTALLVTLYCAVPPAAAALICLDRLLSNVRKGNAFVCANVTCLRVISWCCFAEAAVFIYFSFLRNFALLVIFAFGFMGLVLRVVKNCFEQAVTLREENDFTI